MILADLGAEVIHLEPPGGDDARRFGPFVEKQSAYFISVNRNKKSLVLDLKKPEAREVFEDLIKVSDVILENFRPTTMKKLGFSYEEVKKINPGIIYACISGFGHDSLPGYSVKPAYDTVAQAYSGLMSITGPPDGPPVRAGSSVGDIISGHQCAIGILASLWYREKTGKGQKVDQSIVDGLVYVMENAVVRYTVTGQIPRRLGTRHPSITPFQAFETKDSWIVVTIGNETLWQSYCRALDRPELLNDPRFSTNTLRTENIHLLEPLLTEAMKTKTTEEWGEIFDRHALPFSPINTVDRIIRDPNVRHRGMIAEIEQPGAGNVRVCGSPFHLSETPGRVYSPAPLFGEHTEEILLQTLGYTEERVEELFESKAVHGPGEKRRRE
jgi:CoA:oxalate CoA-transferase